MSDHDNPPRGFNAARAQAERLVNDHQAMTALLTRAFAKAKSHGNRLEKVKADFQTMLRLVKAYASGDYRRIPWTSLLTALASIVYFVNPFDIVPDVIPGIGLLDDATVIAFCLRSLRGDLAEFVGWEKTASET